MPAADQQSRRWRVAFTATLLLAMTAGTMMQFVLGVLAPFITADLGLSRAQLGSLSTLFFAVGAFASPFAGRIVDRVGGRPTLLGTFVLSGAGLAAMAGAWAYVPLLATMVIAGCGIALINPVTNQLIAVHLPRGEQGVVTGVKQSGVQVGAFLGGLTLPPLALALGWRAATLATVAVALVGVVATRLVVPAPAGLDGGRQAAQRVAGGGAFVRWLAGYAFLMGAGVSAAAAFLVLYAVEALGLSEGRAGFAAALMGGVGILARILWGRAAEWTATSTVPLLILAVTSVVAQGLVWGAVAAGEWLLWLGAAAFGATAGSWNAVGMLAIVREVDRSATGRASGIVQSAFYGGLVVTPIAFGATVDATGAYHVGWAGVTVAFLAATVLAATWHVRDRRDARAPATPPG